MPRAGKPLPGSACATAMTKLLPCQVKVPQPLIDCGNRSIWNGEKNRVTGRNQRFRRGEAPCASPRRRLLGRFSVPAMIAGHRNAALDKPFAQGEANFSRSKKSYLHPITLPFPVRVTRWGSVPEQRTCREHAGTVSYSEYHPFLAHLFRWTNAAIVSSAFPKVKGGKPPFPLADAIRFSSRSRCVSAYFPKFFVLWSPWAALRSPPRDSAGRGVRQSP